jgi:uncharacterized protein YraI
MGSGVRVYGCMFRVQGLEVKMRDLRFGVESGD